MSLFDLLTNPLLWLAGLVLWYLLGKAGQAMPDIYDRAQAKNLKPRSFVRGGKAPSKTAQHIRAFLGPGPVSGTARFNLVDPGVRVVTPVKDAEGNFIIAPVDIIVWDGPGHVVLIQVDDMNKSTSSAGATLADLENSRALAATGWHLLRLRIGEQLDPAREAWRMLDPITCIPLPEFDAAEHGPMLVKAIRQARPVDPSTWDKHIVAVTPQANAEGLRRQYMKDSPY